MVINVIVDNYNNKNSDYYKDLSQSGTHSVDINNHWFDKKVRACEVFFCV